MFGVAGSLAVELGAPAGAKDFAADDAVGFQKWRFALAQVFVPVAAGLRTVLLPGDVLPERFAAVQAVEFQQYDGHKAASAVVESSLAGR